jgi:maltooligosyltrehalose trehalohydrolase
MLWMGEEWAASTRWPFFTSHPEPALAKATGEGRLAEFADHGWDVSQMIDPQDPAAYREAILDWDELAGAEHRRMLEFYRRLIALRADEPDLRSGDLAAVQVDYCDNSDDERWIVVHRGAFRVAANLSAQPRDLDVAVGEVAFATDDAVRLDGGVLHLPAESAAIVRTG